MFEDIPFRVLLMSKWFAHFGEYVRTSLRGKVVFVLLGLVVFLVGSAFSTVLGGILLYRPNFVRFLVLSLSLFMCLVLIVLSLLSVTNCILGLKLPMKTITGELLGLSVIIYSFLFVICVEIGMFRVPGWLPRHFEEIFLSEGIQYPILNPIVVMLDNEGGVFIGIQAYGRIQKYSPQGTFEKGWNIDAGGGTFYLWRRNQDSFSVYSVRTRKYSIYDMVGNIVHSERITPSVRDEILPEMPINALEAINERGEHFMLRRDVWTPVVVKRKADLGEEQLFKDPYGFLPKRVPMAIILITSVFMSASSFLAILLMYRRKCIRVLRRVSYSIGARQTM